MARDAFQSCGTVFTCRAYSSLARASSSDKAFASDVKTPDVHAHHQDIHGRDEAARNIDCSEFDLAAASSCGFCRYQPFVPRSRGQLGIMGIDMRACGGWWMGKIWHRWASALFPPAQATQRR